jgi:hypothetical protein
VYICYVDESGTPDIPGNTSHFVLAALAIPIWHWKDADREISRIMARYDLSGQELHTAWVLRPYLEQEKIPGIDGMSWPQRRTAVQRARNQSLLKLQQRPHGHNAYKQAKKNYNKSDAYIHLLLRERLRLVDEIADCISGWGFARLFFECIDKIYFDPVKTGKTIEEQAFEQIISRFERFLQNESGDDPYRVHGILVHDNNETVARKHTLLMREFHKKGTLWINVSNIIETPMFVDSKLTSMVQMADVCAYAVRRYVENKEMTLFDRIFQRAYRSGRVAVGVRHYTDNACACAICASHR